MLPYWCPRKFFDLEGGLLSLDDSTYIEFLRANSLLKSEVSSCFRYHKAQVPETAVTKLKSAMEG